MDAFHSTPGEKKKRSVPKFPASTEKTHSVHGRRNWDRVGINDWRFFKKNMVCANFRQGWTASRGIPKISRGIKSAAFDFATGMFGQMGNARVLRLLTKTCSYN